MSRVRVVLLLLLAAPAVGWGADIVADRVVVHKSERKLVLYRGDETLAEFDVALGGSPDGHKQHEGDRRTPEGEYLLTNRRINSDFFMAIQVSYPNGQDRMHAQSRGLDPGGQIMVHGQPNQPRYSPSYYRSADWTDGCIAVSNAAMVDIWELTAYNTPITILP